MTEEEARFILFKAAAAYPNQIELEDEIIMVWIESLADVPVDLGLLNLNHHIRTQRFFPSPADIIQGPSTGVYADYKQLGQEVVLQLEKKKRLAVPMPVEKFKEWLN